MPEGTCRLCQRPRELLKSHLVPAAYYRLMRRKEDKNPNPIVVSPTLAYQTSKQVQQYLLCAECEDRFNKGGERWVIENGWRGEGKLPILKGIQATKPVYVGAQNFRVHKGGEIPNVDVAKLVYFAASIFWRAAAHKWGGPKAEVPIKLELGKYEEALRLFLLGEADLPETISIVVSVNTSANVIANEYVTFPFLQNKAATHRTYKFVIPGLSFMMLVGNAIPPHLRLLATQRAPNFIFMSQQMEERTIAEMAKMVSTARVAAGLRQSGAGNRG